LIALHLEGAEADIVGPVIEDVALEVFDGDIEPIEVRLGRRPRLKA